MGRRVPPWLVGATAFVVLASVTPTVSQTDAACSLPTDVVFVVDSSDRMTEEMFESVKGFVSAAVEPFGALSDANSR